MTQLNMDMGGKICLVTGANSGIGKETALFGKISSLFAISAEQGATTSLYLASSPEVANSSGRYFIKCKPAESSRPSYDEAAAERLWNLSMQLCELSISASSSVQ